MTKKIIQLSTSIHGGAGIAALRTHKSLLELGYESELYVKEKNIDNIDFVKQIQIPRVIQLVSKFLTIFQKVVFQKNLKLLTPFSLNLVKFDKKLKKKLKQADIIHIHSFYNILSMKEILKMSRNNNVYITLHDERFHTGGCHYTCNCSQFKESCNSCPQIRRPFQPVVTRSKIKAKRQIFQSNHLNLITPSYWLANQFQQSGIPNFVKLKVIRNSIEVNLDNIEKINQGELRIGFISTMLNNPYKGFDFLVTTMNQLKETHEEFAFKLIIVGEGNIADLNPKIMKEHYSELKSENLHKKIHLDILLVLSEFDNFPNVLGEALMNGVPIFGTKVGGIEELTKDFNLVSVNYGDSSSLIEEITKFKRLNLQEKYLLIEHARKYFSKSLHVQKLTDFYFS